jgi:hypothetical protein
LAEAPEQPGANLDRDADAGIGDLDAQLDLVAAEVSMRRADAHIASLGELDGVADQVEQHLAETPGVADEQGGKRPLHIGGNVKALVPRLQRQERDRGVDGPLRIERDALQRHLPGFELREIENVVDDREQRIGGLAQALGKAALLLVQGGIEQQSGKADDAVHRRANLVAHRREKRRFGAICRFRDVACRNQIRGHGLETRMRLFDIVDLAPQLVLDRQQPLFLALHLGHVRVERDPAAVGEAALLDQKGAAVAKPGLAVVRGRADHADPATDRVRGVAAAQVDDVFAGGIAQQVVQPSARHQVLVITPDLPHALIA